MTEKTEPVASPRSGMGAREFAAEHVEWLQRITPTGSSKAENDPFAFAEAYAADQLRQANKLWQKESEEVEQRHIGRISKLQAEVTQLRRERG